MYQSHVSNRSRRRPGHSSGHVNGGVYVFRAALAGYPGVVRRVALTAEHTLDELHELLRAEFGWDDPFELEESGAKSARTPIGSLGLEEGLQIAFLFDYGDNWEVEIAVNEIRDADDEAYPQVLERVGAAPPQYPPLDEDEE